MNRSTDCDEKCEKIKEIVAEMTWYVHSWRELAVVWKYCNILHDLWLCTEHV